MKRKRSNTRRRAARMAELQLQAELAREQIEVITRLENALAALPEDQRDGLKITVSKGGEA
ncbi:MAG: hypothetical protein ACOVS5_08970 [Oligoflexus sp.]